MKRSLQTAFLTTVMLALLLVASTGAAQPAAPADPASTPALLSAFFGLDNALPSAANGLCRRAAGQDGMPVILSDVIDPDTLQQEDFAVITESGVTHTPSCVTLSPAVDAGELRTVLLIGELGDAVNDPPVRVEVVGEILTSSTPAQNFVGASVDVTPLEAGPSLVLAESVPQEQWTLDQTAGRQRGDGCPSAGTVQMVRATWAGGISRPDGEEAGDEERALYRVTLRHEDGTESEITPFALADIGDGDNNHLLCLDASGEPVSVYFPEGYLYDPNADMLNPETTVTLAAATPERDALAELTAVYNDPVLDPSAEAWAALVAHPNYAEGAIVYLEIAAMTPDLTTEAAHAQYQAYLDAVSSEIGNVGGQIILTYDIRSSGTGDLAVREGERYVDGVAFSARLPSRAALVALLLSEPVVAAHEARSAALAEVQMMLGTDHLPALMASMPKDVDAASIDTPYVDGKTAAQILEELMAIYPDGGADPTYAMLEELLNSEEYATEPLYYINLYDWGSYGEEGAAAHDRYNQQAQDEVFAHGVRVYARVDIEQNLVGPYHWDRLILPRWPSFEVFTDLRLAPSYVEAQLSRLVSADIYGNYIAHARPTGEE